MTPHLIHQAEAAACAEAACPAAAAGHLPSSTVGRHDSAPFWIGVCSAKRESPVVGVTSAFALSLGQDS